MPNNFLLLVAEVEAIKSKLLFTADEQSQTDRFAVYSRNGRNADVNVLIVRLQINAPVLRQAALRNVHVRHYFQARDNGRLQDSQLRRHSDLVQDPVDSITNPQIVLQWFNVNISRALEDRFANDMVYKFHDRRFGVVVIQFDGGVIVVQHLEGTIRLQNFIEC